MSLDLHFFKKDANFQSIRGKIASLYEKQRVIQDEIEQLEDDYEDAKLSSHNITHNLNEMAQAVGLYKVLWYPEEINITSASQMILPLEEGIKELEANPDKYKVFNAPNGYGNYEDFIGFCKSVLQKCREYPNAVIEAAG
jgi:septation ring formation regulator EzrA